MYRLNCEGLDFAGLDSVGPDCSGPDRTCTLHWEKQGGTPEPVGLSGVPGSGCERRSLAHCRPRTTGTKKATFMTAVD